MDAIITIDEDQHIRLFNAAAEQMFGLSQAAAVGQSVERLIPERYRAPHRNHVRAFGRSSVTTRSMNRVGPIVGLRSTGEEFPVEGVISQLGAAGKKFYTVVLRDLSARREAEDPATRLDTILDDSVNERYIFEENTLRILHVSRGAGNNLGYTMDELRHLTPLNLMPDFTGDQFAALLQPLRTGERDRISFETFHGRKDGTRYPVEVRVQVLRFGGPPAFVATIQDVTERKQTDEMIQGIAEGISAETGEAFFRSLVYQLGKTLHVPYAFVGELSPGKEDHIRTLALFREGRLGENFEYALAHTPSEAIIRQHLCVYPSGVRERFPLDTLLADLEVESYIGCPLKDSAGCVCGIIVVMDRKPLTHPQRMETLVKIFANRAAAELKRKQAEEALRLAYDELETRVAERTTSLSTANRQLEEEIAERKHLEHQLRQAAKLEAIGRLAGGIAHDFNNLLTVILGYSQLLLDRLPPDDPQRINLTEIKKAGGRARWLTHQLLAFSRRQVLKPKVLVLNTVVAGLEPMLRRLIGEDIDLIIVLEPRLGAIRADPGQLEQILLNLAVNSRDAMPQGGRLVVETTQVEYSPSYRRGAVAMPGRYVVLSVSDTGIGMDAETEAHIFEPFFTTKEQGKGTGLGLATVYGIIKQSGGYIFVDSTLGQGTRFHIYLPLIEEPLDSDEAEAHRPEVPHGTETILLVEDESGVRGLLSGALRLQGYTVLEAQDGTEALTMSGQYAKPIHLLLTDMVMPRMNGREVVARLAPERPEMKILYMSGYAEDAWAHHKLLVGARPLLQKPFLPDTLIRMVREVLDRPRDAWVGEDTETHPAR